MRSDADDREFCQKVGQRIEKARLNIGWSRVQLASFAELEPHHLKRIERGAGLTVLTFKRICKALGECPACLMGYHD